MVGRSKRSAKSYGRRKEQGGVGKNVWNELDAVATMSARLQMFAAQAFSMAIAGERMDTMYFQSITAFDP